MTLYDEIKNSAKLHPAHQAEELLRDAVSVVTELPEVQICRARDGRWLYRCGDGSPIPCVAASADYQKIDGYAAALTVEEIDGPVTRFLLRTAFESRFCFERIVSLHAACVEMEGFAVAFTGPSGMGKSTRAMAWVDGLGARLISGDRPAVRIEKNGSVACGVPWDGKEQIFRNVETPLKCILEVRRSPCNSLRRLSPEQARKLLVQQSFVPMWDTDAAFMAMANISALIRRTPVYRVFCGPDADDARAIYDVLVNHPERIREETRDMKIKEGFVLRNVMDEFIVMPTGDNIARFDGAVVLNEVSAFIYKLLETPIGKEDLLSAVLAEYDVEEATAAADLDHILNQFADMGILEQ